MRTIIFKPNFKKHELKDIVIIMTLCQEEFEENNYFWDGDTNSVCVGE